ncbi:T9SS type A sorting domain-containing protein [Hymenobacter chitinivorans]|uniref:Putative secreted protein (Por secretion system target) n=1 Tax=Hymenobacter chitinivorans DSM 11115 TaxID=1121954 RepID=A0A2M9BNN2_9BACT|nr:T9SS type A sorting domain-containing protein [Hymenobacter chitinivorans]PJJ59554.1 putative secreted protein (Por secretion system target) [Hymenobacter chitinivorans DSM 11115]
MKYLLPLALLGALLNGLTATAQTGSITLTPANFPASPTAVDRYRPAHGVSHPGFVLPQPGAGRVWDYSSLTADSAALEQTYQAPPAAGPFPTAQRRYALATTTPERLALPQHGLWHSFTGEVYEDVRADGRRLLGQTFDEQQFALPSTNGTPGNFLRVPAQTETDYNYRTPLPLTATTNSRSSAYERMFPEITLRELGLNAVRVRLVHYTVIQTDEVVGYGTLQLPKPTGGSAAFPALMVRTHRQEIDSAYLQGQPAPAAVLQALQMEQGQRQDVYQTAFYRENSSQPALLLYHTDATFSTLRNWFSIWFSGEDNLSTITGVRPAQARAGALQAYPNPTTAGQLTLVLPGERQALQVVVRDLLGRQMATAAAVSGQPTPVLQGLSAGLYLVEATTPAGLRSTVRVQVE